MSEPVSFQWPYKNTARYLIFGVAFLGVPIVTVAQQQPVPLDTQQLQRQQQREDTLRGTLDPNPDAPPPPATPPPPPARIPTDEHPCERIHQVQLTGPLSADFQWLLDSLSGPDQDDAPQDRCLGATGISVLQTRMQNALIHRGYITSRVLVGSQDLNATGLLVATFVPGLLRSIGFTPDSDQNAFAGNALPAVPGQPLQLRDVEQGIENLKRPPSADADIQIVPVEQASGDVGQSDLVIHYRQPHPLRMNLSADDGGTKATGKNQGSVTVFWDNPLALNDLLSFTAGHNLESSGAHGTRSAFLNYAVPWDYWLFGASASHNHYHQSVAGASQTYVFSGASDTAELRAQRVVWRTASARTSLGARVYRRSSASFVDDAEVEVQHRVTSVWEINATHRQYLGDATVDAGVAIRRGTGAFGALHAPEEHFGEGTSRLEMTVLDLAFVQPFKLLGEKWQLSSVWHGQWNQTPLTPQDRIAIGSRYSVRGFDGESSLLGDRGWFWRNDLAWSMAAGHEAYLGLDVGQVSGPSAAQLAGTGLAGGVLGLRGGAAGWRYDFFVGRPIHKPAAFQTARTTGGFNVSYAF